MKTAIPRLLALALFFVCAIAYGETCKVVGIADGDTLTVRCDKKHQERVRLTEIDAPEMGQPFGKAAKTSLSAMCFRKNATLRRKGKDDYGRTLARVTCDGMDTSAEQVRRGYAWVYDRYVTDRSLYALQRTAQREKRGLWAGSKKPVPPWEWRRKHKK